MLGQKTILDNLRSELEQMTQRLKDATLREARLEDELHELKSNLNSDRETTVEIYRLHTLLSTQAFTRWKRSLVKSVWDKWSSEVGRTRLGQKVDKLGTNRALGKKLTSWTTMVLENKRLRFIANRISRRWRNNTLSQAWERFHIVSLQQLQTRRSSFKAVMVWANRTMHQNLQKWESRVNNRIRLRGLAAK